MDLSFCITCKGRLHHLKKTLPVNLWICEAYASRVEIVLLDYNSSDGLCEWIPRNLVLKVYRTSRPQKFHISHAKNVVHRLASGKFLCNLDADNFLTDGFVRKVLSLKENEITYGKGGSWGRICITRDAFFALGGYDEAFQGWGMEDKDLVFRAKEGLGFKCIEITPWAPYIEHGDEERFRYFMDQSPEQLWEQNRTQHLRKMEKGEYIANQNKSWGKEAVKAVVLHNV